MDEEELGKEYYPPSQSMELYSNKTKTFYTFNGQQLRNPREYQPDEDGTLEPFGDE
jgi:hypothetical protein